MPPAGIPALKLSCEAADCPYIRALFLFHAAPIGLIPTCSWHKLSPNRKSTRRSTGQVGWEAGVEGGGEAGEQGGASVIGEPASIPLTWWFNQSKTCCSICVAAVHISWMRWVIRLIRARRLPQHEGRSSRGCTGGPEQGQATAV